MGKAHKRFALVFSRIVIIFVLLLATIIGPIISDEKASAIFHRGTDYFSGASPRYLGYNECNIKSDGYYGGASHDNFINAVREAENRPYNAYNCYGLDAIGARYVVHTMLGRGVQYNAGKKWERISAADWTEFDRRIRTTTMSVEARQYNANGCLGSATSFNREDVNQYFEQSCNNTYTAVVFRVNGTIVYIVDTRCMNPVGDYAGPPSIDFNLNPTITSNSSTVSEGGGSTVNLTPTVNNTGTTASSTAQWQVNTFRINPGLPIPGAGENGNTPQVHYGNGATSIANGTGIFQRGVSPPLPVGSQTIGDYPVGTRICYALSVQPATQSNGNWRHSTPFCVTIAKKPKVQVLGGDLWVGKGGVSNVQTSTSTKTISSESRIFGSWGEYGLVASGTIVGMASGAGYSGGSTATSAYCDVSFLTFTNAGSATACNPSTSKGGYRMQQQLPDIGSRLIARTSLGANPTWNVSAAQSDVYSATGTVSLTTSGGIGKGKWIILNAPTATVTIRDNIVYTGESLTTINEIPQVVIIANEIRIEGDVTQVDAWLVASGTTGNIITCTDVANAAQLNAGNCTNRLTVNGPVMARHLYLYRTAGSGTGASSGAPAEVFNLRPDAYLWATAYSATAGRLQTITTTELPPRF